MSQRRSKTDRRSVVGVCLTFVVAKYLAQAAGLDSSFADLTLKFTREPEDAIALRGSRVVLDCSANSSNGSDVTISWRKDGEALTPDSRRLLLANGSLVIQQFAKQQGDEGTYECIANVGGYSLASHQAELQEAVLGAFSGHPSSTSVPVGGNARFECSIDGILKSNITWRKNGLPLPPSERSIQLPSGVLQLLNVASSDVGSYSCHASIFGREANSPVAELSIESGTKAAEAVRLLSRPEDQEVRLGATVTFECLPSISGYSVLWSRKDGVAIPRNRSRTFGCGNLEIQGAQLSDVANYSCDIVNASSSVGAQAKLTVTGTSPVPPSGLRAHSIDSRSIELTWDPSPAFVVGYSVNYWSLPGGRGRQEVVTRQPPQRITNLQPFTNYTFFVKTYNRWGDSEPSQYIVQATLEDVPVAAPTVHVEPLTATSLLIFWDELERHEARGIIVQYKIFYKRQEATTTPDEIVVPGTVLRHDLTDLEANRRYSVRVLAATAAGFSLLQNDQWPWVSRTVGESTDDEGSANVEIHVLNATTVQIIWGPPKPNEDGLEIFFNVFGGQPKTISLVADQTEHILDGLVPGSDYEFKFRILLTDENSGDFYTQTVRMPPLETPLPQPPRLAPIILEAAAVNDTAIRVSWQTALGDAGTVVNYGVHCVPVLERSDSKKYREIFLNSTETNVVITGLMPTTEYEIMVRSYYGNGPGPLSSTVTCHTEEGRPPALLHVTWFLQGPTAVQLNWKMPPHAGAGVSRYVILYCEDKLESDDRCKSHVENGSLCYTVINGLKGRTVYQMHVHAENGKGAGPVFSLKVLTGIPQDGGGSNDRLMGIVIGVGISGGCIVICIIIILLRNRCFPPPRRSPALAQHANGIATPLHCKGYVTGYRDCGRCDGHEPDGTTPMLTHSQDHETGDGRIEMPLSGRVDLRSSVDSGRARSVDMATAVV